MTPGPGIDTLVGGDRSHHYAIPAPHDLSYKHLQSTVTLPKYTGLAPFQAENSGTVYLHVDVHCSCIIVVKKIMSSKCTCGIVDVRSTNIKRCVP